MADSRYLILGTAGHIDHGKTALVRLLTGTDTDRLKEEKARGISIDLGFAHLDLPGGLSCGVVDVPGHERFVKNMLAGACGMDAILLVVAADEGIMPQTREHLDIIDLLGVRRGVVALTKIDLVEPEWLDLARHSVEEGLASRGFGEFPIVPVSSKTGAGKEDLLHALARVLGGFEERSSETAFRLPVDRAFTVLGFGTVVTGTLWRGTVRAGDRLVVEPGARETRARSVEVHGAQVPQARAGQRVALSLAGLATEDVPRGSWVLAPGSLSPSSRLDLRLRVLADAPKGIRHGQRVRFHLGASETLGRVLLLEGDQAAPGSEVLAQILLENTVVADRNDAFVIRTYSPMHTVAGGRIILPGAPRRRRGTPETLDAVRREESGSVEERLLAVLETAAGAESVPRLARTAGLGPDAVEAALAGLLRESRVVRIDDGTWISSAALGDLARRAEAILAELQAGHPLRWGTSRGALKSRVGKELSSDLFDRVLRELADSGRVSFREDHVRLGEETMALPPNLRKRVEEVSRSLEAGGMTPPTLREFEEKTGPGALDVLEHLTFQGVAVKVTPELFLGAGHWGRILAWLETFFLTHEDLAVSDLRDAWGMSRKFAVPLLEHLDRQGWTRRVGDVRVRGRKWTDSPSGRPPVGKNPE